jgi:hypothetical protein
LTFSTADTHIHTNHSDGNHSPVEVVNNAVKNNIKVIAITDHNTISGAIEAKNYAIENNLPIEIIIGEEISSKNGHIIALYIDSKIPAGLNAKDTINEIHKQNGLAVAPHISHFFSYKKRKHKRIKKIIKSLNFDAIETITNSSFVAFIGDGRAQKINKFLNLPVVGVSDAHDIIFIGKGYTVFEGHTADDLRKCIINKKTKAEFKPYCFAESVKLSIKSVKVVYRYAKYNIRKR